MKILFTLVFLSLISSQVICQPLSHAIPPCTNWEIIGTTYTDVQALDGSPGRIIYEWPDQSIAAVWNIGYNFSMGFPDRGTGYNFFNGSTWAPIPTTRLESIRSGYPNIITDGDNGEIIFSHNSMNLNMLNRLNYGTGPWVENISLPINYIWSRVARGGPLDQTIHLICSENLIGNPVQEYPMFYCRSDDNGLTWSILNYSIPQLDASTTRMISPSKNIACRGNLVAIVTGGHTDNLILTKSIDNGNTWTNTIINQFPIPLYDEWTMITDSNNDGIADTVMTTDKSTSVIIDYNDVVHVWVGKSRVADLDTFGVCGYFPLQDGILYWNESMGPNNILNNVIATLEDIDNDGYINVPLTISMSLYNCVATSMPTAGINDWGHLFVAYSAFVEDTLYSFPPLDPRRNIYELYSLDNGQTWTTPFRVCPEEFVDQLFPSMAEKVYGDPKIIYFRDTSDLQTTPPNQRHKQVVFISPDISTGTSDISPVTSEFNAWQTYNNEIHCQYPELNANDDATISVFDVSGRLLYSFGVLHESASMEADFKTPALTTGLYLVTLNGASYNNSVKLYYQQR